MKRAVVAVPALSKGKRQVSAVSTVLSEAFALFSFIITYMSSSNAPKQ